MPNNEASWESRKTPTSEHAMKQRFIEWLLTPKQEREPSSESAFAEMIGMSRRTLANWKKDKDFIEEWDKQYLLTIGNPARKQEIMDTLYRTATDPDDPKHVQAAKQYMEIEGSLKPQKMQVEVSRDTSGLSDEDLERFLAAKAADELARRREAS